MNNRLQQFLAAENISQSQFADSIGVARASISHILSGRNKPGFDFIESMARRYPSLNLEWLITGNGRMYNTDGSDLPEDDEQPGTLKTKEIDKIVVFFTDGTFAEYK
ncbi:MAG: helix-turn-helix transcriptional regulator [Bacteroidales bacterium]|nr:helix-turn-helix transcriptional regulator [Bacteroidales bacterium]